MVKINKVGNGITIIFTNSSRYLYNNGELTLPLNSLLLVTDTSDMATFRLSDNNDVLFVVPINELQIADTQATKSNIESLFESTCIVALGGGGGGGAVDSVNGKSGTVILTAGDVNAYTKTEVTNITNTKQNTLIAGTNITIVGDTISASGGGTSSVESVNGQKGVVVLKASDVGAYTKTEVNNITNTKLDTSIYNTDKPTFETKEHATATYQVKGDYATNTRVNGVEAKIPSITNLATKIELADGLALKADKVNTYTKIEVDGKIPDIAPLATKVEVNKKQNILTAGANITIVGDVISASGGGTSAVDSVNGKTGTVILTAGDVNAYTKTEVDGAMAIKANTTYVNTELDKKLNISTYNVDKLTFETKEHATATFQPKGDYALANTVYTKTESNTLLNTKLDTSIYNTDKPTFETKTNAAATYQVKGDYATKADVNKKQNTLTAGTNITILGDVISASGGGTSAVDSVNGKTGTVVLTAGDVGALTNSGGVVDGFIKVNKSLQVGESCLMTYENNVFVQGAGSKAIGNLSSAMGQGIVTNNFCEHSVGTFSNSIISEDVSLATLFSVGYGETDSERKNAIEVKMNGDTIISKQLTVPLIISPTIDMMLTKLDGLSLEWYGTQAEYDAIVKYPNTLYYIHE